MIRPSALQTLWDSSLSEHLFLCLLPCGVCRFGSFFSSLVLPCSSVAP